VGLRGQQRQAGEGRYATRTATTVTTTMTTTMMMTTTMTMTTMTTMTATTMEGERREQDGDGGLDGQPGIVHTNGRPPPHKVPSHAPKNQASQGADNYTHSGISPFNKKAPESIWSPDFF
jgi:hypothetical protein